MKINKSDLIMQLTIGNRAMNAKHNNDCIFIFALKVLSLIFVSVLFSLLLAFAANKAKADDFHYVDVNKAVQSCYDNDIYTIEILEQLESNEQTDSYDLTYFDDLGDFCQQIYDELYPGFEYADVNREIRSKTDALLFNKK